MKKYLLSFFVLFLLGLLLSLPYIVKVGNIYCKTDSQQSCRSEISSKINELKGKSLFSASKNGNNILDNSPYVASYKISYSINGNLDILVSEKKPVIALAPYTQTEFNLFTEDGVLVEVTKETNLPKVLFYESVANEELDFIAILGYNLLYWYAVTDLKVEKGVVTGKTPIGVTLVYPKSGDIDLLLGATKLTLSQLNTLDEETRITLVDLRFKNPVIK